MKDRQRILVVEDDESMVAGLEYALAREGYELLFARDGRAALEALERTAPDLVLLDVMLPHRSGFDVLASLRRAGRSVPVILVTAKGTELDKVKGLDLGADDYVTKPFGLAELLARVRAHLRRHAQGREELPEAIALGDASVEFGAMRVLRAGESVALSLREVDMLKLLWRERGRPVSRERFLDEVWGKTAFPTTRTVDQHIAKLRQKVEEDPSSPHFLLTAFGVGYRLEP